MHISPHKDTYTLSRIIQNNAHNIKAIFVGHQHENMGLVYDCSYFLESEIPTKNNNLPLPALVLNNGHLYEAIEDNKKFNNNQCKFLLSKGSKIPKVINLQGIPIYFSGSSSNNSYLLVHFKDGDIENIKLVRSFYGLFEQFEDLPLTI